MTLPPSNAQSQRSVFPSTPAVSGAHSIPVPFSLPTTPALPPALPLFKTDPARIPVAPSADFSHSWDLATGGLKTLTAKRELPLRQERQLSPPPVSTPESTRGSMFLLVILACVVVMLISGGVVLFMTLQP